MRFRLAALAVLVASLAVVRLAAQPAGGGSLPAPIDCFLSATNLDNASAKQLCIGATSAAPARCFVDAAATGYVTQAQAVQLCAAAVSDEPVRCLARLRATSGYVTADIIKYCAALRWPMVAQPTTGSPACIDAATTTGLADTQVQDVCRGSKSAEPAHCVQRGRLLTGLADADLVDLCVQAVPFPLPE
jgi:DNA-binding transcriptional regulator YdaS (Cro superfamily)